MSLIKKIVVKSADQSVVNSVVLVNDDELKFDINATESWVFHLILRTSGPYAKVTITGPDGCDGFFYDLNGKWTETTFGSSINEWILYSPLALYGAVECGLTPGVVQFQFAQNTVSSITTSILQFSQLLAIEKD